MCGISGCHIPSKNILAVVLTLNNSRVDAQAAHVNASSARLHKSVPKVQSGGPAYAALGRTIAQCTSHIARKVSKPDPNEASNNKAYNMRVLVSTHIAVAAQVSSMFSAICMLKRI